ncbi:hypothetical protein G6F44_012543 [Rhizopus delemar]|nr:hypothetical protein G6F44_012543 [Rhizopus delemar]
MNFFFEDGRGGIVDDSGNEAATFVVDPSFRLANLTNLHKYIKNKQVIVENEEPKDVDMKEIPVNKERSTTYNTYTNEDRLRYFFFLHEKLMKPADAAKLANVNPETARKWKREYDNDPEKNIPFKKTNRTSKRAPSQLNENHKMHLINFFNENPSAVIQDAVENLTKSFEGLEIKKSRVAEFMKEECNLSLKVVTRRPKARNNQKNLEARANWVKEWQQKGLHFMNNCVFLDEAGFDVNMRRSRGWAQRGKPAIEETTSARGVSHTVIGAISAYGVVNFISDTLDIMDEFPNLKGFHIVMDNAPIHHHDIVDPIISQRGYIPVHLPPYSPELNPIEMFWKVLKDRVKRGKLTDAETLSSGIIEGSEDIPVEHLQSFIQHSINVIPKCLNKEPL